MIEDFTTHALEAIVEEDQVASYDAETVHIGNPLNFVSNNTLNSSISSLLTKSPTQIPP